MKKVALDNLETAIVEELEKYYQDVTDQIQTDVQSVAKECVTDIKGSSPVKSGKYKQGWKQKTVYQSREDIRVKIYNSQKPQLTHLLEHGHAKVNGGRVEGTPHIAPAEQNARKKLLDKAKVAVKR